MDRVRCSHSLPAVRIRRLLRMCHGSKAALVRTEDVYVDLGGRGGDGEGEGDGGRDAHGAAGGDEVGGEVTADRPSA